MISVCFRYNSNQTFMNQWDYVVCNFKPDRIFVYHDEDTEPFISNPLKEATFIKSISELPNDSTLVIFNPENGRTIQGEQSLFDYVHPENAIYYYGSDSETMQIEDFEGKEYDKVFIPTDTVDNMYSFVAYATTMHDRRLKEWLS